MTGALTIATNLTPPLTVNLDTSGPPSPFAWLVQLIQPTVVGTLPVVGDVQYAPYGAANPVIGTMVALVAAALIVLGILRLVGA